MYVIVWEYFIRSERTGEFEEMYSPTGDWAKLFKNSKGFRGTELLRDEQDLSRYMTIDRWSSPQDYALFLSGWKREYQQLDARCEGLTEKKTLLGKWETY